MALGKKTGGRVKGTPNRNTQDIIDVLDKMNCHPIEGMARIALDPDVSADLRLRANAELAQYVYPKRKAVEHSAPNGDEAALGGLRVVIRSVLDPPPAALPEPPKAWIARFPVDKGETRS